MNMQTCNNGHAEIVFYGAYKDCPFCKYIKEVEENEELIEEKRIELEDIVRDYSMLEDEYEILETKNMELEDKIEELENKIKDLT